MPELVELPPELLALIVSLTDTKSLKSLRLTDRLLSSYASRCLFRVVDLYNDDESCEAFEAIASHPIFKGIVQRVNLNTVEEDYVSLIYLESNDYQPMRTFDLQNEL
jgi:hypothetical protein